MPTVFTLIIAILSVNASSEALRVAVAANVQYAMEEMQADFTQKSGIQVTPIYGASGKLATQIRHGAPFSVFVSADTAFPDSLFAWGHAQGQVETYALGKLVLWSKSLSKLDPRLSDVAGNRVKKLAVAEPSRAPYGEQALVALAAAGVREASESNIVYGESISQVNQYILLGTVDAGLSAKSVVLAPDIRGKGHWVEVDSSLYQPIAQGAVMTAYGHKTHPKESKAFFDYLFSPSAQAILEKYGYQLPR